VSNFSELLEAGEIDQAIQLRLDTLEHSAQEYRTDCEASKIGGAAAMLLGIGMSANPLIGFLGVLSAVGYAYTVFCDYRATGRFCPLPGVRKGIGQLFESVAGAADDKDGEAEDPLEQVRSGLSPTDSHEYELLCVSDGEVCKMLGVLPPAKRQAGYNFLLRRTRLLNSLKLPSMASCREAIALLPESPNTPESQAIGVNTRLGAIAATAAEVEDGPVDELWADDWATPLVSGDLPQPDPDGDRYAWADDLIHFPAVLIYGPQGSGKSSFTSWLLRERIKAGHAVEVWDVHRKFGHWKGLAVHGSGLNYEAVDSRMGSFRRQVQARYLKEATVANPNHSWYTAVCEELTNFQGKCENVAPLFKQSLSDLRKIKMCVIYCSHGRTLGTLGGSKGTADMRDSGLIELELQAKINPVTRELVSAQKGKLKLPNRSPISVEIADWMRGSVDFSDLVQVANPVNEVAIASVPIVAEQEDAGEGVLDAKQNSKRVGDKVVQGLRSSGSEWVSLSPFLRDSFNNTEDRAIAKHLIGRAIVKGQLEMEERENTNKSKSVFVRVKRKLFANTNPD